MKSITFGIKICPMKKPLIFISILLSILIIIALFFLWKQNASITYVVAEERPLKKVIYASGYVKPKEYVVLRSEVSGYIKKIYVKEGDTVGKGMLLAEIDPKGLPAQIAEIEKRLAQVEERLKPNSDYLTALRREIDIAKTNMIDAEAKLKRREALYREGLISREDLENAKKQFDVLKENYEKLKNTFKDTVRELETERKVLLEQRRALRVELSRYAIRAPVSGIVLQKFIEEGDFVNALSGENRLFSIGSRDYEIVLEVDEEYAGLVREGQKVYVAFDVYPDQLFEGEVFLIVREIDRAKRSFNVKVRLNKFIHLPAMATAEANIVLEERKGLVIPKGALIEEEYVEVKGRGKIKVKVGEQFGDYVEIISGLSPGDLVKVHK